MDEINDGGQAFPISDASGPIQHGLTIRDWFAGQALTAISTAVMTNRDAAQGVNEISDAKKISTSEAIALMAYQSADAMIKQRDTSGR